MVVVFAYHSFKWCVTSNIRHIQKCITNQDEHFNTPAMNLYNIVIFISDIFGAHHFKLNDLLMPIIL